MYSCDVGKAAGDDKKLWKRLEARFGPGLPVPQFYESRDGLGSDPVYPEVSNGMSIKLLYYLIATMNQIFPDYDFGEVSPEAFASQSLFQLQQQINTTLFNTGLNKNVASFNEFSNRMWECIDKAIGLDDTEAYSFVTRDFDTLEDPFWDRGCV